MRNKTTNFAYKFIPLIPFIAIWELVARLEIVRPIYIGMPSKIIRELVTMFSSGQIFEHLFLSLRSLGIGLSLAIIIGVLVGVLVGSSRRAYRLLSPYINILSAMPTIAIMPLIILWFGIGWSAKVAIIFIMAVIPILISTIERARDVNPSLINMAKSFEAPKGFIIKKVIFYDVLPTIFSSLKIASGRAVIGMVVAEFLGIGKGVGYLISFYSATLQTNKMLAVLIVVLMINFVLTSLIDFAKMKTIRWP